MVSKLTTVRLCIISLAIGIIIGAFGSSYPIVSAEQKKAYDSACRQAGYDRYDDWFGSIDTIGGKPYIKCFDKQVLEGYFGDSDSIKTTERWIQFNQTRT